ncbi:hypothetical protein [Catellatospora sp. NPDC049133]|uniref:hypothetical protein n=1 Tax=Catellatospora sp. NPDC049133 TaxID=3155499 RepID=UPI0033FEF0CC
MPYAFSYELKFAGVQHEAKLEYGVDTPDGEGAGWMVDMPTMLRLLQAAENGDVAIAAVGDALRRMMASYSQASGCCPDCDYAMDAHARALKQYEAAADQLRQAEAAMTPESHPFVVSSSGKVHSLTCRSDPGLPTLPHPGRTVQEFVHESRMFDGVGSYQRIVGSARRVTTAELAEMLGRRSTMARCKLCQPALPGAYGSEASDVEAGARR